MELSKSYLQARQGNEIENFYNQLHALLLQAKLSHYVTKSFAAHEAFGKIYDSLNALADEIVEQLVGLTKQDPKSFKFDVKAVSAAELGEEICKYASQLCEYADKNKYNAICNLADELHGVGAKLKYLSRFS